MRFWNLSLRNLKETYRDPLAMGFILGFPLVFMLLSVAILNFDTTSRYPAGINFIAPGIIIFGLLILIPTSARIMLRDKEKGLLSRLLTTPTRPSDFISGYFSCLLIVATVQIIIFVVAGWLFGMDIAGNLWLALLIFVLAGFCSIGIGIIIASLTKSKNQAESICWISVMPLAILSGCWFSIERLPSYLRNVAYAFPYAHAIDASRSILIRGAGLEAINNDLIFMVSWTAAIFIISIVLSRKSIQN